jgi:hypothetical protein
LERLLAALVERLLVAVRCTQVELGYPQRLTGHPLKRQNLPMI